MASGGARKVISVSAVGSADSTGCAFAGSM
jgi:hypothetical protein